MVVIATKVIIIITYYYYYYYSLLIIVSAWKKIKGKTSKFVDAGGYNRNERGSTEKGGEEK